MDLCNVYMCACGENDFNLIPQSWTFYDDFVSHTHTILINLILMGTI